MAQSGFPIDPLNYEKLLERILTARPNAGIDEVRRLAPSLSDTPDKILEEYIATVKRHFAAKSQPKT